MLQYIHTHIATLHIHMCAWRLRIAETTSNIVCLMRHLTIHHAIQYLDISVQHPSPKAEIRDWSGLSATANNPFFTVVVVGLQYPTRKMPHYVEWTGPLLIICCCCCCCYCPVRLECISQSGCISYTLSHRYIWLPLDCVGVQT